MAKAELKNKVAKKAKAPKRKAYMDGGKFISVAEAQKRGWARIIS